MKPTKKEDNKFFWMRSITLGLFFCGIAAGLYRFDGLCIFLSLIIAGDILSDAIVGLKNR